MLWLGPFILFSARNSFFEYLMDLITVAQQLYNCFRCSSCCAVGQVSQTVIPFMCWTPWSQVYAAKWHDLKFLYDVYCPVTFWKPASNIKLTFRFPHQLLGISFFIKEPPRTWKQNLASPALIIFKKAHTTIFLNIPWIYGFLVIIFISYFADSNMTVGIFIKVTQKNIF